MRTPFAFINRPGHWVRHPTSGGIFWGLIKANRYAQHLLSNRILQKSTFRLETIQNGSPGVWSC
jgi:hypothetical protein